MADPNDVYLRQDAGDGQNDVRLRQDAADSGAVTYTYVGTGGIVFSGVATLEITHAYTPSGGITFAGSAPLAVIHDYAPAGGTTFGGAGVIAVTKTYPVSGGISFGGAAPVAFIEAYDTSGGIAFAGAAATSYTPGVVVEPPGSGTGGGGYGGGRVLAGAIPFPYDKRTKRWRTQERHGYMVYIAPAPRGGLRFSGAAACCQARVWPILHLPAKVKPVIFEYQGTGGIAFSGGAVVEYRKDWTGYDNELLLLAA